MRRANGNAIQRRPVAGYALLTVIFMAAVLIIAAAAIQTRIQTQGRREKEEELIWRGQQYVRGIRLYYRKNGHFPASLEELIKGGPGIRYVRKEYKDPMNNVDGSWRLLYVGAAGQIIGSVKPNPGGGLFGNAGGQTRPTIGTPAANLSTDTSSASNSQGQTPGSSVTQGNPTTTTSPGLGQEGATIGGSIIGVASKINRKSIKVYDTGTTYREWEFIYNPSRDVITVGQPGTTVGTPAGGTGGTKPGSGNPPQNPPPQIPQ